MSDTSVLEKFLKGATDEIEKKRRAKKPKLNGQYRNRVWYEHLFKNLDADAAYDIVVANIKNKSFAHEPKIAVEYYREFYGRDFQSKNEREAITQQNEIARLRAEVEELKKQKAELGGEEESDSTGDSTDTGFNPSAGLTQEQFKPVFYEWFERTQLHKPTGGAYMGAWKKYNKVNGEA